MSVERASSSASIGGNTHIVGSVVQAGVVHGDIHLHARPAAPVPRQAAPPPPHFTDRHEDLAALERVVTEQGAAHRPAIVLVTGPQGVGKSALAASLLPRLGDRFARQLAATLPEENDEQVEDRHGRRAAGRVLERFLGALGVEAVPADLPARRAQWRSLTADPASPVAVWLDEVRAADVPLIWDLRPAGTSLLLLTGREPIDPLIAAGAHLHELAPMQDAAAVALLTRLIGPARAQADPALTRALAQACGRLPLALCLTGAQLARRPGADLALATLRLHQHIPDGPSTPARTAVDIAHRGLEPKDASAWRMLAGLPVSTITGHLAAAVLGLDLPQATALIHELQEHYLMTPTSAGHSDEGEPEPGHRQPEDREPGARWHGLVREYARRAGALLDTDDQRLDVEHAMCAFYLHAATCAEQLLTPSHRRRGLRRDYPVPPPAQPPFDPTSERAALAWLAAERANLMAVVRHAAGRGWHAMVWQLVDAIWPLFLRHGGFEDWFAAHELGLAAARAEGDQQAVGRMLTSYAIGCNRARRYRHAEELAEQALDLYTPLADRLGIAQALGELANADYAQGRLASARQRRSRSRELREEAGYERGVGLDLHALGDIARAEGDLEEAQTRYAQAAARFTQIGDHYEAARSRAMLGVLASVHGDHQQALHLLDLALEVFLADDSPRWQARTLEYRGDAHRQAADPDHAEQDYARALELYRVIDPAAAGLLERRLQ